MHKPKEVHSLNIRDFTYVVANLRPDDEEEIRAMLPIRTPRNDYAQYLLQGAFEGPGYSVHIDSEPVAAFGVSMTWSYATAHGWAFGTRLFKRAVPTISHFMWHTISHQLH